MSNITTQTVCHFPLYFVEINVGNSEKSEEEEVVADIGLSVKTNRKAAVYHQ